jgi:branched-chain amino acid transport system ATP-binding protein
MSLLEVEALQAFYGDFQAIFGIDLHVEEGECVAVIGANGAGKSTLLRSILGLHRQRRAMRLTFGGQNIQPLAASRVGVLGMTLVPEGRRLFSSLNVEENLEIGRSAGRAGHWSIEKVYELFPALVELAKRPVTKLSGGQQQMVSIGRALMTNPRLMLCDEISLGLAPIVVRTMYESFKRIRAEGTSLVIVEQDVSQALAVADRIYCIREGSVVLTGPAAQFSRSQIADAYFGLEQPA